MKRFFSDNFVCANRRNPGVRRLASILLACALLSVAPAPATDFLVAQVGKKNRIIFDSPVEATPTPTPTATPTPKDWKAQPATDAPARIVPRVVLPANSAADNGQPVHNPVLATGSAPQKKPVQPVAAAPTPEPKPVAAAPTPEPKPVAAAPTPEPKPVAAAPTPALQPVAAKTLEGPLPVAAADGENVLDATPDLAPASSEPVAPTQSVTINLINKLVQRGILTKEEAHEMITQAQAEAEAVRSQAQSDMFAVAQIAAVQAASDQIAVAQAQNAPASADDVRVTYIPEPVKMQIKEEIKLELAADRATSKWASGILLPNWVGKTKPFFDLRVRFEGDYFPNGLDTTGAFPNFNAINTGAPFDTTGNQFAPQLNANQNRTQFRLRARFGADFTMGENFTSGFRVATGQNNSPVSTNQSMGYANGQGGNFSKYAIWLDRAFLRYDLPIGDKKFFTGWVGRFENPFFSTRLLWDEDLGFDGGAIKLEYEILTGLTPFVTAGAFVVYNTDFNFSSNQPAKYQSYDKYLYAVQTGIEWKPTQDWKLKVAGALYQFENIEGKLSTPYTPLASSDASDTDNSRPSFAQKGNTYMAIRNIVPTADNDYGAINQWQYYGLATKFQEVALTGRIDYNGFEPVQVSIIGEFVSNLAFNKTDIGLIAVNNRGALADTSELDAIGAFEGDSYGWLVDLRVGTPALAKRWDWQVDLGYRWIGSDCVVDGFNDSDFGLGGTNMKGFTVGAHVALSQNVYVGARWMGADSIAGPTYKTNILQLDINSKF